MADRVLCMKVSDVPPGAELAGSIQRACTGCGEMLWVGPAMVEVLKTRSDLGVYCQDCVFQGMNPTDIEFMMPDSVRLEAERAIGRKLNENDEERLQELFFRMMTRN